MQAGGHEFESHHLHVSNEIAWIFDFCDDENEVLTRSKESKRHASTAVNEKPKVSSATVGGNRVALSHELGVGFAPRQTSWLSCTLKISY